VPLEPISLRGFKDPGLLEAERTVVEAVRRDPEIFIARYLKFEQSFGGRYVNSDLFKETFAVYAGSRESRTRYNTVVHNSAAVLAAEQFRRILADKREPERDTAVFLTGIPGAGKTSIVMANGKLAPEYHVIFEGQLATPATSIAKIRQAIDAGLRPIIVVVHTKPEAALENTFRRFDKVGRGASIAAMSNIQGGLPDGLAAVHRHFGDTVALQIIDKRNILKTEMLEGWNSLGILGSEGDREQIRQRLEAALDQSRAAGSISDACWRQAAGLAPLDRA